MEVPLRRALGLYFVVTALQYGPAALFMLGVRNTMGPNWILPAIPFTQGVVTAAAGLFLLRSPARPGEPTASIVVPPVQSVLQLFGIFFMVRGLVSAVRVLSPLVFSNYVLGVSAGSDLASSSLVRPAFRMAPRP